MGNNEHMVGSISHKRESIGDGPRVLPDRCGGVKRAPFDDETYENPPYARARRS